ncbi:MAG TPA: diacylglycerol kinase family protein [Chloroflexota bacterium]|nr:diacylglycerol kinase family protein [Chloroflexota bacterium]
MGPGALLIANPYAGSGAGSAALRRALDALAECGWRVEVRETAARGDASRMAAEAAASGLEAVLVAGGDGTLNEAIQGLVGSATAIGALPLGTVNVWVRELGLSLDPAHAARQLASGQVRRIDLGRANGRYFLLMAGLGPDAEAAATVQGEDKRRLGVLRLTLAGLAAALRARGSRLRVLADGRRFYRLRSAMVTVGNTRLWAGAFQITDRASAADGVLDACFFPGGGPLDKLRQAGLVILRRHHADPEVTYLHFRELLVSARPPLPLHVDGEPYGTTPVRFESAPGALRALVGPGTAACLDGAPIEEPTSAP